MGVSVSVEVAVFVFCFALLRTWQHHSSTLCGQGTAKVLQKGCIVISCWSPYGAACMLLVHVIIHGRCSMMSTCISSYVSE